MCRHIQVLNCFGANRMICRLFVSAKQDATCDSSNFQTSYMKNEVKYIPFFSFFNKYEYIFQQQFRNFLFRIGANVNVADCVGVTVQCIKLYRESVCAMRAIRQTKTSTPTTAKWYAEQLRRNHPDREQQWRTSIC